MKELEINYLDPRDLKPNPWNPNEVDPINQEKLVASIKKEGFVSPVKVRELKDGSLEIVGGEHRTMAAISMGMGTVPVINLGPIDDGTTKRLIYLDNQRYGEDDYTKLTELFSSDDIGSAAELLATMPIDEEELAAFFEHDTMADLDDLDDIDLDSQDSIELPTPAKVNDSKVVRFKLSLEDSDKLQKRLNQVIHDQEIEENDKLSTAGSALMYLLKDEL